MHSTKFVVYMCDNVLPVLNNIAKPADGAAGESSDLDVQLDVLRLFAELSLHCGEVDNLEGKIGKLFDKLVVSIASNFCVVIHLNLNGTIK